MSTDTTPSSTDVAVAVDILFAASDALKAHHVVGVDLALTDLLAGVLDHAGVLARSEHRPPPRVTVALAERVLRLAGGAS